MSESNPLVCSAETKKKIASAICASLKQERITSKGMKFQLTLGENTILSCICIHPCPSGHPIDGCDPDNPKDSCIVCE